MSAHPDMAVPRSLSDHIVPRSQDGSGAASNRPFQFGARDNSRADVDVLQSSVRSPGSGQGRLHRELGVRLDLPPVASTKSNPKPPRSAHSGDAVELPGVTP
jgi:hypothetical protein